MILATANCPLTVVQDEAFKQISPTLAIHTQENGSGSHADHFARANAIKIMGTRVEISNSCVVNFTSNDLFRELKSRQILSIVLFHCYRDNFFHFHENLLMIRASKENLIYSINIENTTSFIDLNV